MDTKQAYGLWAAQYDTNKNETRDLEAEALLETLSHIDFDSCLEVGCGTGKNTQWFVTKAKRITAIDLSEEMLSVARKKIASDKVNFLQADILQNWTFAKEQYHLVSFSLVLEHIESIDRIFEQVSGTIIPAGYLYIGELHPFKQYSGSKAKFDSEEGQQIVTCFNHNISDFTQAGKRHGFTIVDINEFFDNNDRATTPRILTILMRKS